MGRDRGQTTFVPLGELSQPARDFDLGTLITHALIARPDLLALRHARDATQAGVRLAKAERAPDVDVGATYTRNGPVVLNHPVDPTPGFNQLGLSLSLPLPLWNRNQHEVRKAEATADQAQRQLEAAELTAQVAIRTAHSNYQSSVARLQPYRDELLRAADTVLTARRYS